MSAPLLHLDHVTMQFGGLKAVSDFSLAIHSGELIGLIGPNGAGKTTTMECIEGLRKPDRGSISVLGLDPIRDAKALQIGRAHV